MKHYKLDQHTDYCIGQNYRIDPFYPCDLNKNHYLFFTNGDFNLFSYNKCIANFNEKDYHIKFLKHFFKNIYLVDDISVKASQELGRNFTDLRRQRITLNDPIPQIHSFYIDACGKKYGIVSNIEYKSAILNSFNQNVKYEKSKEYLEANGFNYMVQELKTLHQMNIIYNISDIEIHKSINTLIKSIKQTKTKNYDASKC